MDRSSDNPYERDTELADDYAKGRIPVCVASVAIEEAQESLVRAGWDDAQIRALAKKLLDAYMPRLEVKVERPNPLIDLYGSLDPAERLVSEEGLVAFAKWVARQTYMEEEPCADLCLEVGISNALNSAIIWIAAHARLVNSLAKMLRSNFIDQITLGGSCAILYLSQLESSFRHSISRRMWQRALDAKEVAEAELHKLKALPKKASDARTAAWSAVQARVIELAKEGLEQGRFRSAMHARDLIEPHVAADAINCGWLKAKSNKAKKKELLPRGRETLYQFILANVPELSLRKKKASSRET